MDTKSHIEESRLGVLASVVMDREDHCPTVLPEDCGRNLRELEDALDFGERIPTQLVDEISIVSVYSLHVALYALQNPTPENIARALTKLALSGDIEEHVDTETWLPLPVEEPSGWADE